MTGAVRIGAVCLSRSALLTAVNYGKIRSTCCVSCLCASRPPALLLMSRFDSIVIGGGLVGSAVAYGLARRGLKVALLDEGDVAYRASRGNFGLVWVQSKGLGVPEYQRWTRQSSTLWDDFAVELKGETGVDVAHEHRGGVHICITEKDFTERRKAMEQLHLESGETRFQYEMLDHAAL